MEPAPVSPPGQHPGGDTGASLDDLLVRASRGDQVAFADLYDRTSAKVYGLARRVIRDPAQAEEVTQEVFIEVWTHAARYDAGRGGVLPWILTMTHRRAVDRVRSTESARQRDTRFSLLGHGADVDIVSETVMASMETARVRKALTSLTELQREAITLAYYGGYTYQEVATLLGVPIGTIKTRMRDGLIRLRDTLGVDE